MRYEERDEHFEREAELFGQAEAEAEAEADSYILKAL